MTGHLDKAQLNSMTKDELAALADKLGLDSSGRKADLVKRIAEAEVEAPDEADDEDKAAEAEAAEDEDKAAEAEAAEDEGDEAAEQDTKAAAPAPTPAAKSARAIEAGGSVLVTCIWEYHDNALKRVIGVGEQLKVTDERAALLTSLKLVKRA